jgi:hypothetical protein
MSHTKTKKPLLTKIKTKNTMFLYCETSSYTSSPNNISIAIKVVKIAIQLVKSYDFTS